MKVTNEMIRKAGNREKYVIETLDLFIIESPLNWGGDLVFKLVSIDGEHACYWSETRKEWIM